MMPLRLCWLLIAYLLTVGSAAAAGSVAVVRIDGPIGPATAAYVDRALTTAAAAGHAAIILELDTPGGLVTATRYIVAAILASPTPIIGYVAPAGAQAASAGTYILMATHIAAMAPATNVGAATPVQMGGSNPLPTPPSDTEEDEAPEGDGQARDEPAAPVDAGRAKAINDAAAYLVSLAELRGRNAEWAEAAVREASSLAASAALEMGAIDVVANDRTALLEAVHGSIVTLDNGAEVELATRGAIERTIATNWQERLLSVITNPNIAYILMLVGIYGIIFELANPGLIGSGVIGAISLLLGLFALNFLPLDFVGLALMALGIALMVGEALTPGIGILAMGGAVSFALGSALLIDTDAPGFEMSLWVIGAATATSAAFFTGLLALAIKAQRGRVVSGVEEMVGQQARVVSWTDATEGTVHVAGEQWRAIGTARFRSGDSVRIDRVDGLTLHVSPSDDNEVT